MYRDRYILACSVTHVMEHAGNKVLYIKKYIHRYIHTYIHVHIPNNKRAAILSSYV